MNVVFFCIISPLSYLIFFFLPLNCMFNDYNEYIERCTYQLYILIFLLAHFLMKRERERERKLLQLESCNQIYFYRN